ncbi:MAG: hypothetical protein Q8Q01_00770 [archaeon]|nr:hypothetical protein [archaeon]
MVDKYEKKHIKAIKNCVTDDDLAVVINRIYDDGFQDGANEGSKSK